MQVQLERTRNKTKPATQDDYAKDPDNVDIRDENGEFVVSKFKQI